MSTPGRVGGRLWRRPVQPPRIAQLPPGVDVRFAPPRPAPTAIPSAGREEHR
jgi:hypothetical protein